MKEDTTYSLQKYAGRNTRHTCPQCGKPHCFSFYVDAQGNVLDETVGRCDHESSCGYHKTPKQYFEEHPALKPDWRDRQPVRDQPKKSGTKSRDSIKTNQPNKQKPLCTIPKEILGNIIFPSCFIANSLYHTKKLCAIKYKINIFLIRRRESKKQRILSLKNFFAFCPDTTLKNRQKQRRFSEEEADAVRNVSKQPVSASHERVVIILPTTSVCALPITFCQTLSLYLFKA